MFPYLIVPYDGEKDINQLIYQLAQAIDKAINISFRRADSDVQHVFNIVPVSGTYVSF